ncbi:MAG TPA: ASKHA domain-containing protein [Sedimentisphaerales bacterium]|nr:ASKHA domain-containing protein [Sedimentisphaerales bacterium]
MKHFNVTFEPDNRQISIHAGATLIEAAGRAGIVLNTVCGGKGICRKCLVNVQPDSKEVLACQYHIQSDLTVTILPASRFFEQQILAEGIAGKTKVQPDIYQKYRKPDSTTPIFGAAVDIGTTTVVARLFDMTDGRCAATEAGLNPQARFGDDVISRIGYAQTDEKLAELRKVIIDYINELIGRLCRQASIDSNDIYEISVVGNTTMNHIFLKLPITQLGQAPYKAFSLDAHDCSADQLGLYINPAGNIHTVENIAGFVGADTTAVALATGIDSAEQITLAVDIGTNGEIVLAARDKLYAASCAAGPAFEGARISCGSRAVEGAIQAVVINDSDIDLDVIGTAPARSICGSGLIDAVAVMLDLGIIDPTGRFVGPQELEGRLPPVVFSRIIEHAGQPAFVLAAARQAAANEVILTQRDIRQVQLAKAAIRAGITLLEKKLALEDADIEKILLAGAFGNYICAESALRMGLLPDVPAERIHFVGNAACSGAEMVLLSSRCRAHAKELARKIQYVEIAHEKHFSDVFADSMAFRA